MTFADMDHTRGDFVWKDGERMIAFGPSAFASLPAFLRAAEMEEFVLLATERSVGQAADVAHAAAETFFVRAGRVDEIAAELLDRVAGRPIVAVGGGRVIDVAKSIGGADRSPVAAVPTTLSGAPMTPFHRLPAGYAGPGGPARPRVVIAVPELMTSQPIDLLAGSAMNALSHAIESLFVTTGSPIPRLAARSAIELLSRELALTVGDRDVGGSRTPLALGAIEAGYAVGATGFGVHHVLCQTIVRIGQVPHAPTYGVMLPFSLEFLRNREPYAWESVAAAIDAPDPSTAIARLAAAAGLPTNLRDLGVSPDRLDAILADAEQRAELALTPGGVDIADLRTLLEAAF